MIRLILSPLLLPQSMYLESAYSYCYWLLLGKLIFQRQRIKVICLFPRKLFWRRESTLGIFLPEVEPESLSLQGQAS